MRHDKTEKKITYLLEQLTLSEKIKMIHGGGLFRTGEVERLLLPPLKMSDGPMGVRHEFENASWIPACDTDDYVSYCPSNSSLAMTWNRELCARAGTVLGEEARGRGKDVILAPGINIKRVPVCGRNFEYFSEDPYLISELCVPFIKGVEQADVAACVKHFALNNQEYERRWLNVEVSKRALYEIYLPGFGAAVKKAHVRSVMGAYNLYEGEHCCHNKVLLDGILREKWKYDGMIVSDWGGVHDTVKAAQSALDVEMSVKANFDEYFMANPLYNAVQDGLVDEAEIDKKIRNILRLMLRIRLVDVEFDENGLGTVVINKERKTGSFNTAEHRKDILDAARESIVLLKNEDSRLPLVPERTKKLLVIGDNAMRLHAPGGGSAEIKALYEVSPLLGLKCLLGGNFEITFARGYEVPKKEENGQNWQENSLNDDGDIKSGVSGGKTTTRAEKLREEAVKLAGEFDDVIFIGGLNHEEDLEGHDREDISLPYGQDELIRQILLANPNTVIVMIAGSPVDMTSWEPMAKAVLFMGYAGMECGTALAETIFGIVNPSGKLAETFPKILSDCGALNLSDFPGRALNEQEKERMNARLTQTYGDGIFVGYRYYDKYHIPVQYCFGHGLSYTTFDYDNFGGEWVENENGGRMFLAHIDIKNTGRYTGAEVVQFYLGEKYPKQENAVKELKGFEKVFLEPGRKTKVTVCLEETAFEHYHEEKEGFEAEKGDYILYAGSSLDDIRGCIHFRF